MHEEELDRVGECADCRTLLGSDRTPHFDFAENGVLCFECALRRGAAYDGEKDTWTRWPDLSGIPDAHPPLS